MLSITTDPAFPNDGGSAQTRTSDEDQQLVQNQQPSGSAPPPLSLSPLQYLVPADIFGSLLEYLDLASLCVLAGQSVRLNRLVYGQPALWSTVDFATVDPDKAGRVTDLTLRSLLERSNAGAVTRVLRLTGCASVTGSGLAPLAGSDVLELIDLRISQMVRNPKTKLEDRNVLGVLESIRIRPSSRLSTVRLQHKMNYYRHGAHTTDFFYLFESDVGTWLRQFHTTLRIRARATCAPCGRCGPSAVSAAAADDGDDTPRMPFNFFCEGDGCKFTCSTGSCPQLHQCNWCQAVKCEQCCTFRVCTDDEYCGCFVCEDCFSSENLLMQTCEACGGSVCFGCLDDHHGEQMKRPCRDCNKIFCSPGYGCNAMKQCSSCSEYGELYCRDCRQVSFTCTGCDDGLCDKCHPLSSCEKCKRVLGCSSIECRGRGPWSEIAEICSICKKDFCSYLFEDCQELFCCDICGTRFCRSCRQPGGCSFCCIDCSDECYKCAQDTPGMEKDCRGTMLPPSSKVRKLEDNQEH